MGIPPNLTNAMEPGARAPVDEPFHEDVVAAVTAMIPDILRDFVFYRAQAVYVADRRGELLYCNTAYRKLAGIQGEGAGDGNDRLAEERRAIVEQLSDGHHPVETVDRLSLDNNEHHFATAHFPVTDEHGLVVAAVGTYVDQSSEIAALSDARHSQTRLNDVIRSSSDWVWETDEALRISYLSERVTEAVGLPPASLYGRSLFHLGHFADEDGETNRAIEAMKRHLPFRSAIYELVDRNKRRRYYHISGVPVFDDTGTFSGYRGTVSDVTSRYEAEQSARQTRQELEHALTELRERNIQLDLALERTMAATKAKDEFLATMSHELRTPLNAIIGFSDLIARAGLGPIEQHYKDRADLILKAGHHLLSLIDDILDLARIEAEELVITPEPTQLSVIVGDSVALIEQRAKEKGIDVSGAEVAEDLTLMVDPRRTLQILVNLLTNAIKFTQDGGNVGIEVDVLDHKVAVVVTDNGPGIPDDKQELVFHRFQQAHDDILSRREAGAGLGLSISRHLARLMGGDITLQSKVGEGSRFTVTLPFAKPSAGED